MLFFKTGPQTSTHVFNRIQSFIQTVKKNKGNGDIIFKARKEGQKERRKKRKRPSDTICCQSIKILKLNTCKVLEFLSNH